jgi:hypothetical protein
VDESLPDETEGLCDAIEAMLTYESTGKEKSCNQPRLLDALVKGKKSREFHITSWLSMVRSGEAWPEEFFCCLGLRSSEEFRSIFGRLPSLPLLRRILRELEIEIETYDSMSPSSDNGETACSASWSAQKPSHTETGTIRCSPFGLAEPQGQMRLDQEGLR